MRVLLKRSVLLASLCFLGNTQAAEKVVDFDWDLSQGAQLDSEWIFTSAGDESCGNYNMDQDKYCTLEHRLFLFYSGYDSDHKGWMRYGAMFPDSEYSISGNALKMVFTGGRDFDENGVAQDYGAPVKSYEDYQHRKSIGDSSLYAERLLPGQPMIYYKPKSNEVPTLGIFPNHNRFIVHAWMPPRADRHARYSRYNKEGVSSPARSLAWYPFIDSPKGSHYYHHAMNRPYGGWIKVEFDAHPTHSNAGPFNDLHSFPEGARDAPSDGVGYFSRIAAFAVRFQGIKDSVSPTTILTDEWQRDFTPYENEETIANLGLGYDPEQKAFDVSLEDKYRCTNCKASYEVRYSFSPIDNGNFDSAKPIYKMENFFIEDDNAENLLKKPNGGYNAVWGKFFLQSGDVKRYLNGEKIYVAVKDVSTRTVPQDSEDTVLVSTPFGDIQKQRLVKVIDMEYRPAPSESGLHVPSNIYAKLQEEKRVPFRYDGFSSTSKIISESDYALRANVEQSRGEHKLKIDPWQTGEFGLVLKATDNDGVHKQAAVKVNVDGELCGYNKECDTFVLADFTAGEPKLNYAEFSGVYYDEYTGVKQGGIGIVVGDNPDYNYQGIAGGGLSLLGNELVVLRVKNMDSELAVDVQPKISGLVADRPANSTASTWRILESENLAPGEAREWAVPVQEFAQGYLSRLTVSLGVQSQNVVLTSLSLLADKSLECVTCARTLVDFFATGSLHDTPQRSWNVVLKDAYTNKVGEGMGITIGSNRDYNYQGVAGTRNLSSEFNTLAFHWVNNSDVDYTFTPRYSFDDPDRPTMQTEGTWFSVGEITIKAGDTVVQLVNKPSDALLVNSNVNVSQQKAIYLDKITDRKSVV